MKNGWDTLFGEFNLGSNFVIFFCMISLLTMGCSKELSKTKTISRSGLLYEIGSDEPFTGYIVGKSREGYRSTACTFKKQYKDGVLNGKSIFWYKSGKVESVEPYKDGKLHGVVTRYYSDGKKKAKIHFVDGQRGGAMGEIFWDKNGRVVS